MLYWLGVACHKRRDTAGVSLEMIAVTIRGGSSRSKVERFEKGETVPRNPDDMVEAYSVALKVARFTLWAEGLALWQEHGPPPPIAQPPEALDPDD